MLIRFWWPWLYFQGHRRSINVEKCLLCLYLLKGWMDLKQTCRDILLGNAKEIIRLKWPRPYLSKSQEVKECWKNGFLACISWRDKWFFSKVAGIYYCELQKSYLDLSHPESICKVTGGWKMLENALSALHLLKGLMDFIPNLQICIINWCKRTR